MDMILHDGSVSRGLFRRLTNRKVQGINVIACTHVTVSNAPPHAHEAAARRVVAARCAIITVSDTRTRATDTGGKHILDQLTENGHFVASYVIVPDCLQTIRHAVLQECDEAELIILTGGTGISKHDNTYEAVQPVFNKEIVGFGELFRALSYQEIGSASMLSRAVAGTFKDSIVFSVPGSLPAVRLAMERLILPEIRHLVSELRKHQA